MKHTGTFIVRNLRGQQYTVHELTEEGADKRYELPDSPGTIHRIDDKTFQIKFPFANAVTATVV